MHMCLKLESLQAINSNKLCLHFASQSYFIDSTLSEIISAHEQHSLGSLFIHLINIHGKPIMF